MFATIGSKTVRRGMSGCAVWVVAKKRRGETMDCVMKRRKEGKKKWKEENVEKQVLGR